MQIAEESPKTSLATAGEPGFAPEDRGDRGLARGLGRDDAGCVLEWRGAARDRFSSSAPIQHERQTRDARNGLVEASESVPGALALHPSVDPRAHELPANRIKRRVIL